MSKQKKFDVVAAVKDASRTHIGPVPPTRVVPDKLKRSARKANKHPKLTIEKEMDE